jgi:hypothetical protein
VSQSNAAVDKWIIVAGNSDRLVNFEEFSTGGVRGKRVHAGLWRGDFTARPELAEQLISVVRALARKWSWASLNSCRFALRDFFRFLDAYEAHSGRTIDLAAIGESLGMSWRRPVDDKWPAPKKNAWRHMRQILYAAHNQYFAAESRFVWPVVSDKKPSERDCPTRDEARAALTLLKREAQAVFARWKRADDLAKSGKSLLTGWNGATRRPTYYVTEADCYATYYQIIATTGIASPTIQDIRRALGHPPSSILPASWTRTGISISALQEGRYPKAWDLNCLSQLFMARTGWNASTVFALDISNETWCKPHGDPAHDLWILESWKERSTEWQQTICRGRVTTGPLSIVTALLQRTEPLRQSLRSGTAQHSAGVSAEKLLSSPWIGLHGMSNSSHIIDIGRRHSEPSKYWHALVAKHNAEVDRKNVDVDELNRTAVGTSKLCKRFQRIPEGMVPSDWRDIYADFVFVDSRYSWVAVQWALGHKHILSTRNYLRKNLWRRYSEDKLLEVQTHLFNDLRHGRLDVVVLRSRIEFNYEPSEFDLRRLREHRQTIRESELTISGYFCSTPRNPPKEIDPGNPSDGSMVCRRGERCAGCPVAIAVDPLHMVKRKVEIERLRRNMSLTVWTESHLGSDLEILNADLKQWDAADIASYVRYWTEEFDQGRRILNPWSSAN